MIGIIDYGMGNIQSVRNALEREGASAGIIEDGARVSGCDALVLPGVGAFGQAMENLRARGFTEPIRQCVADGTPLLGICLGLQLLAEGSEEHGWHDGLGIIPGQVRLIPVARGSRLPHVGWNVVRRTAVDSGGQFDGVADGAAFYFVHTYALQCPVEIVTATADYDGPVTAAIRAGSVFATQFHPERSQSNGLRLLRNFVAHVNGRIARA
jgi:glutamine amidotransferase